MKTIIAAAVASTVAPAAPVAAVKPTFTRNLSIRDFVKAQAGHAESQFDLVLNAVYTAYYHVFKAGNSTQFGQLADDVKLYASINECKTALATPRVTAEVKRFHAVYLAYGAALESCGSPRLMKKASADELDAAASAVAAEFASIVTVALAPKADTKTEKQAAKEKAERKAKREADKQKEIGDAVAARMGEQAQMRELSADELVTLVCNMVKSGLMTPDQLAMLDSALDSVAANVEHVMTIKPGQELLAA